MIPDLPRDLIEGNKHKEWTKYFEALLIGKSVWVLSKKIIAHVAPSLLKLTLGYVQNCQKDIKDIGAALEDSSLKSSHPRHSMKGLDGVIIVSLNQCGWSSN